MWPTAPALPPFCIGKDLSNIPGSQSQEMSHSVGTSVAAVFGKFCDLCVGRLAAQFAEAGGHVDFAEIVFQCGDPFIRQLLF